VVIAFPALVIVLAQVIYVLYRYPRGRYRRALAGALVGVVTGEVVAAIAGGGQFDWLRGPLTLGGLHVLPDVLGAAGAGYVAGQL
jgi:mannose/fructose/N-acetylgalactosamine-specific phosphotransferase system component IIC